MFLLNHKKKPKSLLKNLIRNQNLYMSRRINKQRLSHKNLRDQQKSRRHHSQRANNKRRVNSQNRKNLNLQRRQHPFSKVRSKRKLLKSR